MVQAEAGLLLPQAQLTAGKLAEIIGGLNREKCLEWAENARTLAMPGSAGRVAEAAISAAKAV